MCVCLLVRLLLDLSVCVGGGSDSFFCVLIVCVRVSLCVYLSDLGVLRGLILAT